MAKVVIIGAGLTGLSTAYHLEKKGFTDFIIVEKEAQPGGLCRSVKQDGFTFDYSGHLLHSSDDYFSSFLKDIFSDELLNTVQRRSFIYSHDTYTRYPYQINLHGLPPETIIECIEGYVNRKKSIRKPKTFSEWVLKFFGQGLAESFFFPYQAKLLQYDPKKLAASWTGRFVPQTSLRQMLYGALQSSAEKVGYNASFLYPKLGIQCLIDRLIKKINKPVVTGKAVANIDLKKNVIFFEDGDSESFDIIINTMPLDLLLHSISDHSSTHFNRTAENLLCTSVACLNLGISRNIDAEKHWIYYPEKEYPFYRVGFYHNFSSSLVPASCSSMYVECSYKKNASYRSLQKMINDVQLNIKQLFNIDDSEIIAKNIIKMPHAYVVYDAWRERNLSVLLDGLKREGIYSIGRYGAWKYSSMQESVLDGKKVADTIVVQPACHFKKTDKSKRRKLHEKRFQL